MKTAAIILFFCCMTRMGYGQDAEKPVMRGYYECGLLAGAANFYHPEGGAGFNDSPFEGMYMSVTTDNGKYLGKLAGTYFSGNHGTASSGSISAMFGHCFLSKYVGVDVCGGVGFYAVDAANSSPRWSNNQKYRGPGLTFESNIYLMPAPFLSLSPGFHAGITPKSYDIAFVIKLGFGKFRVPHSK